MSDEKEFRCPSCGSESFGFGYGLAGGGGIGAYRFCLDCGLWVDKHVDVPGQCLHGEEFDGQDR